MAQEKAKPPKNAALEYLRRSFKAVDGLWFVKVEQSHGLEAALDLDRQVWEVTGKIQVRTAKKILDIQSDRLEDLAQCLQLKFSAENYQVEIKHTEDSSLELQVLRCPWLEALRKSERMHLGPAIADKVCAADYGAWAQEFNKTLEFCPADTRCAKAPTCRVRFVDMK